MSFSENPPESLSEDSAPMLAPSVARHLDSDAVCGLNPRAWLCVGGGYSREDFKALLLTRGRGFIADAITTPQELASKILEVPGDRILASPSRQEILKFLLSQKKIAAALPEMKKARRNRSFFKRLDQALLAGRLAASHSFEAEVFRERLSQAGGDSALRRELEVFAQAYEAWMRSLQWWDLPMLFQEAIQVLRQTGWPQHLRQPQRIIHFSGEQPESLEKAFWEALSVHVQVTFAGGSQDATDLRSVEDPVGVSPQWIWERWHTLDDAVEAWADQILGEWEKNPSESHLRKIFEEQAVLIPDAPEVRRSLTRALQTRQIPFAEPRDPTGVRTDEQVKQALLPLQLVASGFERNRVLAWLRQGGVSGSEHRQELDERWIHEIQARGVRRGLLFYRGGELAELFPHLERLSQELGGRKTCRELAQSHLQVLAASQKLSSLIQVHWEALQEDMNRVGQLDRKAPLLFWLERLETRIFEASPPVEPLKPAWGVRLYRLSQAPVLGARRLWLFGLPARWFSGDRIGDLWYSERDREVLSPEFAVRSRFQLRQERLESLKAWVSCAEEVVVTEAEFDGGGREQESLKPCLRELALSLNQSLPQTPILKGAYSRSLPSYSTMRKAQPTRISLKPLTVAGVQEGEGEKKRLGAKVELSASTLDRYSRCGVQSLALDRWKLRDVREPSTELWPDVKGTLLHEAVRIVMQNRSTQGVFRVPPQEAMDRAWVQCRPAGLIRSERVEKYVRTRLTRVLEVFCEKEKVYFERAQTQVLSLDQRVLRYEGPEFVIRGKPDRMDQSEEGLFIMDYKSSGGLPHGVEMLEQGYRLQLPFYAVAAMRELKQPVLGVQFIELDPRGARKSGICFASFNGREPGKLTTLRSNSKSLIHREPEEVWIELERAITQAAQDYISGSFEARPRIEPVSKECQQCRVSDFCGYLRRTDSGANTEEEG